MPRKLISLMTLCVLLCSFLTLVSPVYAATEASITVEYVYDGEAIADVEIEIFLIGTWQNGSYELSDEFKDLDVDFEGLSTPSSWRDEGELVEAYIAHEDCSCEECQHTDSSGLTTFPSLSYGVYYVSVADVTYEDGILLSSPVLLTVPSYDEGSNAYVYDIYMEPKVAFIGEPDIPDIPDTPDTPTTPRDPGDPDEPEEPDIPDIPDEPGDPDIPVIPDEPDIPDIPDEPEIPQTGSNKWLVLPLALLGSGCIVFAIFGLREKRVKL